MFVMSLNKKNILLILTLGLILTLAFINSSKSYLIGLPMHIYSLLPLGYWFGVLLLYSYNSIFIFLLFHAKHLRMGIVLQLFAVFLYFEINMLANKYINFNIDFSTFLKTW